SKFELTNHLPAQSAQSFQLIRTQLTRLAVYDTKGAQCLAVRHQRCARIESNFRIGNNQGIVCEPFALAGVGNNKNIRLQDRGSTKSDVARGLKNGYTHLRLEPLPVSVHKADQRDGSLTDIRGQEGEIVERGFRFGIENLVAPQCLEPLSLIRWFG